jgi:peptide/nickel transport system permease protein
MVGFAVFLMRRLLGIAVLVWVTTLVAFGLFRLGVPSQLADGQIDAQLGRGEPASWQYIHYLLRLLHGNLGGSITVGLPVDTVLARALPPTLSLMIGGILLLLALFSYTARSGILWLQPGYVPLTRDPGAWFGRMILPWIAIAATQVGVTARLTRDAVLGVLGEDYIRTAYAKGLPTRRVLWLHVLRPSLVSVLPSIGIGLGTLLGAAAIVDQAFALDGVGQALLTAVKYDDVMTIMGAALITVILISVVNLVVDVCQTVLDPRIDLL